jgi:hypothetical protein
MFAYYPKVKYDINSFDTVTAIDITIRTKINNYLQRQGIFGARTYTITNGELPEIVSYNLYGKTNYAYILLLVNGIHNMYDEWPRNSDTFKQYIKDRYGSITAATSTIAHYYTGDGFIVSEVFWNALSDSEKYTENFYELENRKNNEKATIKIVRSDLITKIEMAIQEIMNSAET